MSATILPPISRAVSRMSVPEESSLGFVEKEKFNEETLNDTEAEAEAAASAVAVAAISNDETVGDELGSDSAVSRLQDLKGEFDWVALFVWVFQSLGFDGYESFHGLNIQLNHLFWTSHPHYFV